MMVSWRRTHTTLGNMFDRIFFAHPRSVGESYFEHMRVALGFAGGLFVAASACFVHAFVPSLHPRTASRRVALLYQRMITARKRFAPVELGALDYAI
jgi:hypothetical protein